MEHRLDLTGTRSILSNLEEYRDAVAEIATRANRTLSIYTTDLEPLIYDHDLFLEPVKRLVLARMHNWALRAPDERIVLRLDGPMEQGELLRAFEYLTDAAGVGRYCFGPLRKLHHEPAGTIASIRMRAGRTK
jgi:hypothetical protein